MRRPYFNWSVIYGDGGRPYAEIEIDEDLRRIFKSDDRLYRSGLTREQALACVKELLEVSRIMES